MLTIQLVDGLAKYLSVANLRSSCGGRDMQFAFRLADASALAPLVKVELIVATIIGYVVFSDIPDTPTVVRAGFITAAGLILLQRRNRQGESGLELHE